MFKISGAMCYKKGNREQKGNCTKHVCGLLRKHQKTRMKTLSKAKHKKHRYSYGLTALRI